MYANESGALVFDKSISDWADIPVFSGVGGTRMFTWPMFYTS